MSRTGAPWPGYGRSEWAARAALATELAKPAGAPLHVVLDPHSNCQAQVHRLLDGRYSVIVRDNDTGELLPATVIYKTEAGALEGAKMIAAG